MIDNYDSIINDWTSPKVGCCTEMVDIIHPDCDMTAWAVQKTVTVLANADYYYTREEVDNLLSQITVSGVTSGEVETMIARAIASKADKSTVDALAEQVRQNTEDILNRPTTQQVNTLLDSYYSKLETDSKFAKYSKVEGTTLVLNSEGINI